MAYNEKLADRVRESLNELPGIEEKKMFRGITFMVNGKMCVSVGDNELMLCINPTIQKDVLSRKGCRVMIMNGREYKGYILINEDGMRTKEDFDYWISIALDFNKIAKASLKGKKK